MWNGEGVGELTVSNSEGRFTYSSMNYLGSLMILMVLKIGSYKFRGPYGNRRKFWCVIALASWLICGTLWMCERVNSVTQTGRGTLRTFLVLLEVVPVGAYPTVIMMLFYTNKSFINLARPVRLAMESAFLVTCLAVPELANNSVQLILGYLACFHLIPMANLIASIQVGENLSCLLSLSLAIFIRSGTLLNSWGIAIVLLIFHIIKYLDETLTNHSIAQHDRKEIQDNNKHDQEQNKIQNNDEDDQEHNYKGIQDNTRSCLNRRSGQEN